MSLARLPLPFLLVAILFAAGCCCPISGRYDQPCLPATACQHCPSVAHLPNSEMPPPALSPPAVRATEVPKAAPPAARGDGEAPARIQKGAGGGSPSHYNRHPRWPVLASWFHWRGFHSQADGPYLQHADYLSPPARFHPVPTRPVFEPQ